MPYFKQGGGVIAKVDKEPSEGPENDAFPGLDAAMKKKAAEHSGKGNEEAARLLRELCPESNKLFVVVVSAGSNGSFRLEIAHTPEWKDYTASLIFGPDATGSRRDLTVSFFDDGTIKQFFWSTSSPDGNVENSSTPVIPNGSATEQQAALQTALEYLRVACRIGNKSTFPSSDGKPLNGGGRGL